jgi:hypothetical protein
VIPDKTADAGGLVSSPLWVYRPMLMAFTTLPEYAFVQKSSAQLADKLEF